MKTFIYYRLWALYFWLSQFGYYQSSNNRYYDHFGEIDTLGSRSDNTKFTQSFSEELGSWYLIKLPFGHSITLFDYGEKDIVIK